jgi:hypothetical protein
LPRYMSRVFAHDRNHGCPVTEVDPPPKVPTLGNQNVGLTSARSFRLVIGLARDPCPLGDLGAHPGIELPWVVAPGVDAEAAADPGVAALARATG